MTGSAQAPWVRPVLAALLVALGLGWSAHTFRTSREVARRLKMRREALAEIRDLADSMRQSDCWIEALRQQGSRRLVSPTELYEKLAPETPAPVAEEKPPLEPEPGWRVRRIELEFRDVALPAFGAWLTACENLRPAWRATRLHINTQTISAPDHAEVGLSLEGIEITSP